MTFVFRYLMIRLFFASLTLILIIFLHPQVCLAFTSLFPCAYHFFCLLILQCLLKHCLSPNIFADLPSFPQRTLFPQSPQTSSLSRQNNLLLFTRLLLCFHFPSIWQFQAHNKHSKHLVKKKFK